LAVASSKLLPAVFCLLPISFYLHQNPTQKKQLTNSNFCQLLFRYYLLAKAYCLLPTANFSI